MCMLILVICSQYKTGIRIRYLPYCALLGRMFPTCSKLVVSYLPSLASCYVCRPTGGMGGSRSAGRDRGCHRGQPQPRRVKGQREEAEAVLWSYQHRKGPVHIQVPLREDSSQPVSFSDIFGNVFRRKDVFCML